MSLEDPFFAVKDEVFKALNKTRGLYLHWRELSENFSNTSNGNDNVKGNGIPDIEWTTNELRNSLRSIEWDLEDLEDTISIVEKNPSKFRIDNRELISRRHFIENTRNEVKQMKEKMSLNRGRDRDITANQPLLDKHNQLIDDHFLNNSNINNNKQFYEQHYYNHNRTHNKNHNHINSTSDRAHLVLDCPDTIAIIPSSHSLLNGGNSINTIGNNCSGVGGVANTLAGTMSMVRHSGAKYSKLENALDSPGHYNILDSPSCRYVGETVTAQENMLQNQDEQLEMISDSIGTLKTVSRQIGMELDEQAVMLDDFNNEFDTTETKLDATMKKMAKVLHMNNDKRQWAAIIILSTLLLIVIILLIIW